MKALALDEGCLETHCPRSATSGFVQAWSVCRSRRTGCGWQACVLWAAFGRPGIAAAQSLLFSGPWDPRQDPRLELPGLG